ncbi:MAG: hypothetical protein JWN46_2021 [Acidimicrobiales bacterium]|nr:hypothetical protein [Acidimicrobiales bacterium]
MEHERTGFRERPTSDDYGRVIAEMTRRLDGGDDLDRIGWMLVADMTRPSGMACWVRRCVAAANLLRGQVQVLAQYTADPAATVQRWIWERVEVKVPAGAEATVRGARDWAQTFAGSPAPGLAMRTEPLRASTKLARWVALVEADEVALDRISSFKGISHASILAQYGSDLARLDEMP